MPKSLKNIYYDKHPEKYIEHKEKMRLRAAKVRKETEEKLKELDDLKKHQTES